jgi:LPXTG-motif cell wall-anchored protein
MSKLRVAAAATVIALLAAFASMGSASAATNGVGTTQTASSLLDVALGTSGSILHLKVLGDTGNATVDPASGPMSAASQMSLVNLTSSILPILNNINLPTPPWTAQAVAGGKTSDSVSPTMNIGTVLGGIVNQNAGALNLPVVSGLVSSVLGGVLTPGSMTASITDGVAKSGLDLNLADLNLVGGLLKTHAVGSTLGATAAGVAADGNRGLNVDTISVLNLGALLRGLGIDPANLVIDQISGLLSSLNVPLNSLVPTAGIPAGTTLSSLVTSLQTTLTQLTGTSGTFSNLPSPVQGTVNTALGGLGGLPAIGSVLSGGNVIPSTDVTSLLTTATNLLKSVLPAALGALDNIDLLKLSALQVGAVTHAVNGTQDSKADVITKIGDLSVAGIDLGAVDLTAALSTITNLVNTITSTVDNALGLLNLDGILTFKLFDKYSNNGVTASGGYTRALAGITGLNVGIHPPEALASIISALNNPASNAQISSIGETIAGLTGNSTASVPVVGGLMNTLNGALPQAGGLLGALAGGATIKVADISSGSNFAVPGVNSPTQVSQLPRTGANTTAFLVIGMLMVGGVIVGRRYIPVRTHTEK